MLAHYVRCFAIALFCYSCQSDKESILMKNVWECQDYSSLKSMDKPKFLEEIKNERKYWVFKSNHTGHIYNREINDELVIKKWRVYPKNETYLLEAIFRQKYYWANTNPNDSIFIKTYFIKTLTNNTLELKNINGVESYTFTPTKMATKYIDTTDYKRLNKEREERVLNYTFKKTNNIYDVANDSARIWGNGEDGFDLTFEHSKLILWFGFLGQCIYEFPIKIENDKSLIVYWDTDGDCVFESGLENKFGLAKRPRAGDKFMSLKLANDSTLKVKYFFPEWVGKFNQHQLKFGNKRFETYSGPTQYLFPEYFKFEKEESKFFIE